MCQKTLVTTVVMHPVHFLAWMHLILWHHMLFSCFRYGLNLSRAFSIGAWDTFPGFGKNAKRIHRSMWCIHKGWKTPTEQNAHGLLAEKHWICERSKVNLPFSLLTPWRYNHTVKLVQQATKLLYCLHNLACQISYVIWKFCHKLLWDMFCHLLRQCLNDHIYFLLCIKKLYETKLLTSAKYCTTSLHVSCFSEQKIKVAINIL